MNHLFALIIWGILGITIPQQETSIIGNWQNEAGNRIVEFYQAGKYIEGKIIEDDNSRLVGKVVFTKLLYNGKTYEGTGFLPKRNQYINCSLKLTSQNILAVTGKAGFVSDTKIWKRLK